MAILEKIRKRSALLIVVIGLSLFAFVLSDVITRRRGMASAPNNIGEINGEEIPLIDFQKRVESSGGDPSNQIANVNYLWDFEVSKALIGQSAEKLGITIDRGLLADVVNSSPVYKNYYNAVLKDGVFDAAEYYKSIASIKAINPELYNQWMRQEDYVLSEVRDEAYNMLVRAGMYRTQKEGEVAFGQMNDKVSFSYVRIPYSKVPDSLVKISDKEISDYVKATPKSYHQLNSADLKYVVFEEKPSQADEDNIKNALNKLLEPSVEYNEKTQQTDSLPGFSKVSDVESFVNKNSDKPYSPKYLFESQLPVSVAKDIVSLGKDQVWGPYKDDGYYKLVRKMESIKLADSVKSSHIIVPFIGSQAADEKAKTKDEAKKYIDSIFELVKQDKQKFAQVADSINIDGTKGRGGDVGWTVYSTIDDASFDKNYSQYIFFNPAGSIGVIESAFGFHIVRIDEKGQSKDAYRLATIARKIEPSEETINNVFKDAGTFEVAVQNDKKSFEEALKNTSYGQLTANSVNAETTFLQGVESPRMIIRWALDKDTSLGDIKRFNLPKGYVVAQITGKYKEGLMEALQARPLVEPTLRNDKKSEKLMQEYAGKSFDELSGVQEASSASVEGLSFKNNYIEGIGPEPEVVALALALNENETSKLIKGQTGVFMVKTTKKDIPAPPENFKSEAQAMDANIIYFVKQTVTKALKDKADIEDNRLMFY